MKKILENVKDSMRANLITLEVIRKVECEKNQWDCINCIFRKSQEMFGCQPDDILVWLAYEVARELEVTKDET